MHSVYSYLSLMTTELFSNSLSVVVSTEKNPSLLFGEKNLRAEMKNTLW